MSNLKRHMTSDKIKWIVVFLLLIVIGGGLIATVVKLNNSIKTVDIGSSAYSVGTLSTTTGEYVEDTSAIYTKDFIKVEGLTIKVKQDANISYKLFFYDSEKEFLSASEALTTDTNSTAVVTNAKYFKIMITPNADNDVSVFEVSKYADRLTVTVNK